MVVMCGGIMGFSKERERERERERENGKKIEIINLIFLKKIYDIFIF